MYEVVRVPATTNTSYYMPANKLLSICRTTLDSDANGAYRQCMDRCSITLAA